MKNRKILWLALIVLLAVAGLLLFRHFSGSAADSGTPEETEPLAVQSIAADKETVPEPEPQVTEDLKEDESQVVILENQGSLEIIIPDDQDSDGF